MKKVLIHWVEMRTLEVPDECPTDTILDLYDWIAQQEPSSRCDLENYVTKVDSRDHEIVNAEEIYE
jgi:hypothetical protein